MLDKLEQVEQRFESIQEQISQPDIVSDMEKYTALMKELKQITPVVDKFREYKKAEQTFSEAKELIDAGGLDPELAELAQEDYKTGKEDMERLTEELKVLLLPRDPNDDKNVIIEIRAGTGGEEAALFAGELYRMYTMYAEAHGFKTEIMSENSTELGGYKEVSFEVKGDGAYSRYKFESGTHRV